MADSDRTWNGLVPMGDADVEMAENEPDPRGWDVMSADGRRIGEVDELLVDPAAMKVRYLDVAVAEDELELDDADRRLLMPMRSVALIESDEKIIVSGLVAPRISGFRGRVDLAAEGFGTPIDGVSGGGTFGRDQVSDTGDAGTYEGRRARGWSCAGAPGAPTASVAMRAGPTTSWTRTTSCWTTSTTSSTADVAGCDRVAATGVVPPHAGAWLGWPPGRAAGGGHPPRATPAGRTRRRPRSASDAVKGVGAMHPHGGPRRRRER